MTTLILVSFFAASTQAETIHLKNGTMFEGEIKKSGPALIEVQIDKISLDPGEYALLTDTSADNATHRGVVVLKDGSYLHGMLTQADGNSVTLQIDKNRVGNVAFDVSAGTSAPAAPQPVTPPNIATSSGNANENIGSAPNFSPTRRANSENEITIGAGAFIPLAKFTVDGQDDLAGPGYAFGAQFFHRLDAVSSVGAEIERLSGGQHDSLTLINNLSTSSRFDSVSLMALWRISRDEGRLRPYIIGGLGLHSTTIQMDVSPQSGYLWADTGTRESRNLINSTKTSAAFTLQMGAVLQLTDDVSLGGGLAYYYLASASYDLSPTFKNLGFAGNLDQPISGIRLAGDVAVRF